jgi:hypothetical protein
VRVLLEATEGPGEVPVFHAITGYVLLLERAKLWLLATEDKGKDGCSAWREFERAISDAIDVADKLKNCKELEVYSGLIGSEIRETWARGLIDRGSFSQVPKVLGEARALCPTSELALVQFHIDLTELQCQLRGGDVDPALLSRCLYDYPWHSQRERAYNLVKGRLSEREMKIYFDHWKEAERLV